MNTIDSPEMTLQTHVWKLGEVSVLSVRGELDALTAAEFRRRAEAALAPAARSFIVDLSGVSHIDGSGVNALIAVSRATKAAGATMGTIVGSPRMRRTFALLGVDRILEVEKPEHLERSILIDRRRH